MRDNRNAIIIAILVLCIIIMMMTIVASASFERGLSARSATLYEPVTESFVFEKDADRRMPMASTTKIMTALVAIESCDIKEEVQIPKEVVGIEGSSLYLLEGDVLTVEDLLYSLLLQSANDAAVALALKVSGDIASFTELMNNRAHDMGLFNTHFENPHGLHSENHYTTAHDLAIIAANALKNPIFKKIASTYKYTFMLSGKSRTVVNHNKLLRSYDGAIGVKTGFTKNSGRCLVSAAERDGVTMIAVTLNAPDDWRDHTALLDYGFDSYEAVPLSEITDTEFSIGVMDSDTETVAATIQNASEIKLIRKRGGEDFSARVDIKPYAVAPIMKGDKLGEIVITYGSSEYARADIVASCSVKQRNKTKKHIFSDLFNTREN